METGPVCVFGSNGIAGYSAECLTEKPAIIVGRKGSAGALNLCDGPSWTKDVAYFVESPSFFDIGYLFFALRMLGLEQLGKGVKPGLSRGDAYQLTLNVPPLSEQHRIVAKIEDLMALCDRLEAAQMERESRRDLLTAASYHHFNNGGDLDATRKHAHFFLRHLPPLTSQPYQIRQLRQAILNFAVRGSLVSQNANDEPAPIL
ncbi:MAG: restriction endonuclease subunit S, partial [Candidatus Acidiferrales bacterium]